MDEYINNRIKINRRIQVRNQDIPVQVAPEYPALHRLQTAVSTQFDCEAHWGAHTKGVAQLVPVYPVRHVEQSVVPMQDDWSQLSPHVSMRWNEQGSNVALRQPNNNHDRQEHLHTQQHQDSTT